VIFGFLYNLGVFWHSENIMITVSRKDLESLMKAYESLLEKKND